MDAFSLISRGRACPITDPVSKQTTPPRQSRDRVRHYGTAGAKEYVRARDLPGLISLWPAEVADFSAAGSLRILRKLRRALRAERRRGSAGYWSYNLNRHLGLWSAYKAEIVRMETPQRLRRTAPVAPGRVNERA